jgi:putative FmdB family regulatory protein
MPLYEYLCDDCGRFEMMRRVSERDEPALCPECHAQAERVQTGAQIRRSGGASGDDAGSYGFQHRGGCSCCG